MGCSGILFALRRSLVSVSWSFAVLLVGCDFVVDLAGCVVAFAGCNVAAALYVWSLMSASTVDVGLGSTLAFSWVGSAFPFPGHGIAFLGRGCVGLCSRLLMAGVLSAGPVQRFQGSTMVFSLAGKAIVLMACKIGRLARG